MNVDEVQLLGRLYGFTAPVTPLRVLLRVFSMRPRCIALDDYEAPAGVPTIDRQSGATVDREGIAGRIRDDPAGSGAVRSRSHPRPLDDHSPLCRPWLGRS